MTPLQIQMLLHFHVTTERWPNWSPACTEARDYFFQEKLLDYENGIPVLTDRGRAYVKFLCMIPLPNAHWTIPGPLNFSLPPEVPQ